MHLRYRCRRKHAVVPGIRSQSTPSHASHARDAQGKWAVKWTELIRATQMGREMKRKLFRVCIVTGCVGLGYLAARLGIDSGAIAASGLIVGAIYWLAVRVEDLARENARLRDNIDRLARAGREMRMNIDHVEHETMSLKSRSDLWTRERVQSWEEFVADMSARAGAPRAAGRPLDAAQAPSLPMVRPKMLPPGKETWPPPGVRRVS